MKYTTPNPTRQDKATKVTRTRTPINATINCTECNIYERDEFTPEVARRKTRQHCKETGHEVWIDLFYIENFKLEI